MSKSMLNTSERKLRLHYWYVEEYETPDGNFKLAYGIVTGHKNIVDSMNIHTSCIRALCVDYDSNELVVTTQNSVYYCPLEYCSFEKQDKYPETVPDYERIKEIYQNSIANPTVEPGNVLLVLSNYSEYYFHSLYYVPKKAEKQEPLPFEGYPHVGMHQDSFLIRVEDNSIDIRYFPHFQNIEFYSENTHGMPLYLENIGDIVLYVKCSVGTIKLEPGKRKQVIKENVEYDPPVLPCRDLYPVWIIEENDQN